MPVYIMRQFWSGSDLGKWDPWDWVLNQNHNIIDPPRQDWIIMWTRIHIIMFPICENMAFSLVHH